MEEERYTIIASRERSLPLFISEINEFIGKGFKPLGGLVINNYAEYLQAMWKEAPEKEPLVEIEKRGKKNE